MLRLALWTLAVLFDDNLHCTAQTHDPPCPSPSPVSVLNGGFENGKIAPWSIEQNTAVNATVVSPGYKSKDALRLDSPRIVGNADSGYVHAAIQLIQTTTGKLCYGYYYNLSVAYNWLHFVGPPAPRDPSVDCYMQVYTTFTSGNLLQPLSSTPGWHTNSTIIRADGTYCNNTRALVGVLTTCGARFTNSTVIPGFTLLLDDIKITAVKDRPPTPPLPTNSAACTPHS